MKRILLSSTATVAGLIALLSFKTQTAPVSTAAVSSTTTSTSQSADSSSSDSSSSDSSSSDSSSSDSSSSDSGSQTYTGDAVTNRYGVVQVEVTVSGGQITDVEFAQLTGYDGKSQQINSYAGPQLLAETLQNQNGDVDTVSGATYTSDSYAQSLQSALDQAGLS